MIDALERNRAEFRENQQAGGWRVVAAAWALLLFFMLLLAAVNAAACPRANPGTHRHIAAAVIPQHDPCVGADLPSVPDLDGCKSIPPVRNWTSYANYR